ncbi:MAG: peptidylprolyl isomerase, partial [Melioribacteraceae bacterium]
EIKDIEARIKSGADFGELALKYSADKGSAARKGDLGYFQRGQMVKEFDEAAFKLNIGEVSPVVKTSFGYHLIRLSEIAPAKSYEEEKQELKEMYDRVRFRNDFNDLLKNLKSEFNYTQNSITVNKILLISDTMKIGTDYLNSNLKNLVGNDELFRIRDKAFTCDSLFNHLIKIGSYLNMKVNGKILQDAIDEYAGSLLLAEKALIYEKENPEFAKLLADYENGIYLFKILEEEVWSKISIDSAKIFAYWEKTKENYRWKDRVEFKEIHNSNESEINSCYSSLISGTLFDTLQVKYNQRMENAARPGFKDLVDIEANELAKQANALKNPGEVSRPFKFENGWSVVQLIKKDSAREKTFEEAKAEAASLLQEKESKRLEDDYLNKLKSTYNPKYYYEELRNAFKQAD